MLIWRVDTTERKNIPLHLNEMDRYFKQWILRKDGMNTNIQPLDFKRICAVINSTSVVREPPDFKRSLSVSYRGVLTPLKRGVVSSDQSGANGPDGTPSEAFARRLQNTRDWEWTGSHSIQPIR